MGPKEYNFKVRVWLYPGDAAWHFITVPKKISKEIKNNFGALAGGWGALPVRTTIGVTRWQTSIFWDNKDAAYILPLKAKVRKQENIKASSLVSVIIELLV
jgi:hypothetical protein